MWWGQSLIIIVLYLSTFTGESRGQGRITQQPTYAVVAPTKIRPNQNVVVAATILRLSLSNSFTIRAVIRYLTTDKYAEEISSTQYTFTRTGTKNLVLKTPELMAHGNYTLRVTGYSEPSLEGMIFTNETKLFFDSKQISVFIFTAKPWYTQGQTVLMRIIPLTTELKPVSTSMDVSMVNSQGIVMKEWYTLHSNTGGVLSLSYPLNKQFLDYGKWTIRVKCKGHIYTRDFMVEEFYPPPLIVRVNTPNYMFHTDTGLRGTFDSLSTNAYSAKGNATVRIDFLHSDDSPVTDVKPLILDTVQYLGGMMDFMVSRESFRQHLGSERALIGKQLKATVSVLDWWWNKTNSAYDTTRVFSDEVLLKFLGGRVWTFKPNAPFKILIAAQRSDQSPLPKGLPKEERTLELVITTTESDTGEKTITDFVQIPKSSIVEYLLKPGINTEKIIVSARYGGSLDSEQKLIATRHWTPSNHFLQISSTTKKPKVNTYMIFNIQTNTFIDFVYYYIVSSGNIVHTDKVEMNSRNRLLSLAISRKMVPSAKIVAFYVAPDGQVASDSLQFHVDGSHLHKLTMGIGRGKDLSSADVKLGLKSAPLSFVGVSIHHKELYDMGARNSFTWDEVNEELYTYDDHTNHTITHYWKEQGQVVDTFHAPTPSFAPDTNSTFYYSGLYIFTDANASAVYTTCNRTKGEYPCMDGLTCYTPNQLCDGHAFCASDHRDEMGCPWSGFQGQVETENYAYYDGPINDDRNLWRVKHIILYQDDGSFGWQNKYTKQSGGNAINIKGPPHGIPWVLNGFALNHKDGLAIASPVKEALKMWMYIIVQGQNAIRFGEICTIKIMVANMWSEPIDVLLSIPASDKYEFMQIDRLDGANAYSVPGEQQILVPMLEASQKLLFVPIQVKKTGSISIPVSAMSVIGGDKATYKVSVESSGVKDGWTHSYQVDLRTRNAEVLPDLYIPINEVNTKYESDYRTYVKGSASSTIYVTGGIIGVPFTSTDMNTKSMFGKPAYSGGEAMFNFAINLNLLNIYRRLGGQYFPPSKTAAVCNTLNSDIQEFLAFLQEDGSFKQFRWNTRSSTWLSANAVEVMVDGLQTTDLRDKFVFPSGVINRTAEWLITQQDDSTGIFREAGNVQFRHFHSDQETEVDGKIKQANFALTALCVMSLHKASSVASMSIAVLNGVKLGADFLAYHQHEIVDDPFAKAIVTYALFVTGKSFVTQKAIRQLRDMRRTIASNDMTYWSSKAIKPIEIVTPSQDTNLIIRHRGGSSVGAYAVTASSYALMAYMANSEPVADLESIQRFLQEQRIGIGVFYSTQDTLVAVRALGMLASKNQDRGSYDMTFTFKSDQDENWNHVIHLNQNNWFDLQSVKCPSHWGTIQTKAKGTGIALVQMKTTANRDEEASQLKQSPIKGIFDLGNIQTSITTSGFNHSLIHIKICPRWNGTTERSGMAVLEINLPSGYKASNGGSIKEVKRKMHTTSLRAAQHSNGLEIFYFDFINKTRLNCAEITSFRYYPVANVDEFTRIKIYEYYEPALAQFSWYAKFELMKLTVCLVCGSYQCPYCPYYNTSPTIAPNIGVLTLAIILNFVMLRMFRTS